jgi:hypothetical protein
VSLTSSTVSHSAFTFHESFTQRGKGSFQSFGRRKARLFSRAGNFGEAKIASARICFTLRIKHTINICESLCNLQETKLRFKHSRVMVFLSTIDSRPSTVFILLSENKNIVAQTAKYTSHKQTPSTI